MQNFNLKGRGKGTGLDSTHVCLHRVHCNMHREAT